MSEPKYFVTEVSECPECVKGYVNLTPEMKDAVLRGDRNIPVPVEMCQQPMINFQCPFCNGSNEIESRADLLEVLGRLRWNHTPFNQEFLFENLRIESER